MTPEEEIRIKCLECALKSVEVRGKTGETRDGIVSVAIRFERYVKKGE